MQFSTRFASLWDRLQADGPAEPAAQELLQAWAEPHRAYHTLQHLRECLELFDEWRRLAVAPLEVEAAIWLHDAVHDPCASDNEQQSADWGLRMFRCAGVPEERCQSIARLVLVTRHDTLADDADGKLIADLDLAIFGAPRERFDEYERQIRQEYHFVPDDEFRAGRSQILQRFLDRQQLYQTPELRQRFEHSARANLARSLASLKQSR